MSYVKDRFEEAKMTANKDAKKIVIQSIQRMAAEHTIENTVSVFRLESDDLKGQIIGREGRNIRALESATGVEIIVDDTPEAIIISSFDPIRREICRLSLQRLVADLAAALRTFLMYCTVTTGRPRCLKTTLTMALSRAGVVDRGRRPSLAHCTKM